ncbi:MAG TPA: dihydroorotate dehydrogenase-like protein [bacterium]|nr:dihydroorotate dehydrogenase-like protein [bacterium]HQI47641.1 dihydroorotate dehydrogenase-like protein [bacterium]HQJ63247.1 dihydroorotate dehydrogenase-like protein [bacterium]
MDLSTTYMGLKLKNPLVPSASPLSKELDTIKKLEDAGAAAIVLYSLFEEQISYEAEELDHFLTYGTDSFAEALSYFPQAQEFNLGPEGYLEHIRKAKQATGIPIIASLNGVSTGGWIDYAKKMEQAGADGLELNVYMLATDPARSSAEIEEVYVEVLKAVKSSVKIPVAMKLSPYFSAMAAMAKRLDEAGADALVLFNRFYQPDLDLEALEVKPGITLSTPADLRLPLRWIAILYGRIKASMAGSSGVYTAADALKLIMAGADVANLCAALLKNGPAHLGKVLDEMSAWLEEHEYASLKMARGSMSQKNVAEPAAYERANYIKALNSYTR